MTLAFALILIIVQLFVLLWEIDSLRIAIVRLFEIKWKEELDEEIKSNETKNE